LIYVNVLRAMAGHNESYRKCRAENVSGNQFNIRSSSVLNGAAPHGAGYAPPRSAPSILTLTNTRRQRPSPAKRRTRLDGGMLSAA
jgi:hypothetical protein